MIPGRERLSEVRVHHMRLAFLEARETGPMAAALHAKAAGDSRPKAFCPGDFSDEVYLSGLFVCVLFVWSNFVCEKRLSTDCTIHLHGAVGIMYTPLVCPCISAYSSFRRRQVWIRVQ